MLPRLIDTLVGESLSLVSNRFCPLLLVQARVCTNVVLLLEEEQMVPTNMVFSKLKA